MREPQQYRAVERVPLVPVEASPSFPQQVILTDLVAQVIAHLAGLSGGQGVRLQATPEGRLLVTSAFQALSGYEVLAGANPDVYTEVAFASEVKMAEVWAMDDWLSVKLTAAGDPIELWTNCFLVVPIPLNSVWVRNAIPPGAGRYQITGWR